MTPLFHVTQAAEHFADGKRMYKFNVPDDRVTRSYIARIRRHIGVSLVRLAQRGAGLGNHG